MPGLTESDEYGHHPDPRAVLVGITHFRDDQTTFYESRCIAGLRDPKGFVLLDEINRATDDANNTLFSALDGQQYLSLDVAHPPRVVLKHPNVCSFATANIGAEYTSILGLDHALRDRFCLVELDYSPKREEEKILVAQISLTFQVVYAFLCGPQALNPGVSRRRHHKLCSRSCPDRAMPCHTLLQAAAAGCCCTEAAMGRHRQCQD
jgi:MoxR-like ATPase